MCLYKVLCAMIFYQLYQVFSLIVLEKLVEKLYSFYTEEKIVKMEWFGVFGGGY